MGKKEDTPLQATIKKDDTLKKTIEKFVKSCDSHLKKKTPDRREGRDLYKSCKEQIENLESHIDEVTNLDHQNESSMKSSKFENKKKDELKKLNTLKEKLKKVEDKLTPDDVEEGEMEKESGSEEEEEEESGSEEDEETDEVEEDEEEVTEDEEDTETKTPRTPSSQTPIKKEQTLTQKAAARPVSAAPQQQAAGEAAAEEARQAEAAESEEEETETEVTEEDSEEESEEEESEEEESEEEDTQAMSQSGTMRQYEALVDFKGEQEGDLSFKEGDVLTIISARTDGWLEAENDQGKRGLVPITYLKVYNKYKELETPRDEEEEEEDEDDAEETDEETPRTGRTPRSGRKLWKGIRQAVKETSATDVLQALGAVPPGFRESTLAKLSQQAEYCTKCFLMPKLSKSCLSFRDLFINPQTNKVRSRVTRVLRVVQLVAARQIPAPGADKKGGGEELSGLDILSRHIRICLFDGKNMLSNIHTVLVASVDKDQKTWHFNNKVTDHIKTIEFGEFFIRSNTTDTNIGILFELCMSYVRRSTNQTGEFSCGWVFLPLYDTEGKAIDFKSYDEFVHGGTPFEKGIDVDPSVGRKENSGMLRSLIGGNKQPRLVFRLQQPTKDQKDLLDTLPDVMVSSTVYIQYLAFYRQVLCDFLIRDNDDLQSSEVIHSPVLSTFPDIADQADMMDVLRSAWAEKLKSAKRTEKRDADIKKQWFKEVYMNSVYPLLPVLSLPAYNSTDKENHARRETEMQRLVKLNKERRFVASLLSADVQYKPFTSCELSFNVTNSHCVSDKSV